MVTLRQVTPLRVSFAWKAKEQLLAISPTIITLCREERLIMDDFASPLDGNESEAGCALPATESEDPGTEGDDEDTEPQWLGYLREEAPVLNLSSLFIPSAKRQIVKLTRDQFRARHGDFLEKFGHELEEEEVLVNELFQYAIDDRQQMDAFSAYSKGLRSPRFRQAKTFVDKTLNKLRKIERLSRDLRCSFANDQVEEWAIFWFGGLQEVVEQIAGELRGEEKSLAEHERFLKYGRTELESHLLRRRHAGIKRLVAGKRFARHLTLLLAAYAHASYLVPYKDNAADSDFMDAIKMRVHRAKRSTTATRVLVLILMQSMAE